jgi:hypothetical protein
MEHTAQSLNPATLPPQPMGLVEDTSLWPDTAQAALAEVRRELDRWCREHDWPSATNSWIAEEAVRRCW